jgi:hypothetical protein
VDGKIDDDQLTERAREELKDIVEIFGKYIAVEEKPPVPSTQQSLQEERAKLANKIYRKVCMDSGLNNCFFKNFATWSDYIHGRISEAEFLEQARLEVQKMADQPQG